MLRAGPQNQLDFGCFVFRGKKIHPCGFIDPSSMHCWPFETANVPGLFCLPAQPRPGCTDPLPLAVHPQQHKEGWRLGGNVPHRSWGAAQGSAARPVAAACLPALAAGRALTRFPAWLGGCPCVTLELPRGWRWGSGGERGRPSAS